MKKGVLINKRHTQDEHCYHAMEIKEVFSELKSSEKGLSNYEAKLRLKKYGTNQLKRIHSISKFKIFFKQFNSFLVYLIMAAAIISLILGHLIDFIAITIIVILNAFLGFFQEYKAEKAIEELRKYVVPKTKVIREGKFHQINSTELVPGDVILLEEGDRIMADSRLIEISDLEVNEAPLTGESMASSKHDKKLKQETILADRENMVYFGTDVVRGKAKAIVVSTGMRTEFGHIAKLVQEIKQEKTPLQIRIDDFSKKLGFIIIGICVVIFLVALMEKISQLDAFLTAVSLAVSAIPEGLPAVITLVLALTVQRMARVNAIVRKLPAAETLGRVTYLCTDKTGTLTQGEMKVIKLFFNNKVYDVSQIKKKPKELEMLMKIGVLCNNARVEEEGKKSRYIGDPTEKAIVEVSNQFEFNKIKLTEQQPKIKEFEFSSSRKMMTLIRRDEKQNKVFSYVKGSPEKIISRCNKVLENGKIKELNEKRKRQLLRAYEKLASDSLRVLGFAYKPLLPYTDPKKLTEHYAEHGLIFVGFEGMYDPPREEVKAAIEQCKQAGIKVIMITGDSALTAKAIANQIGLSGEVVEADKLKKISDGELKDKIKNICIFARVSPKDKLRIVDILKEKKEVVGMTGDGVNDAPALKRADIGIAMGIKGTDVAKEVSEIILLDDNFATIVKAVREGRRSYSNVKKFIKFLLSANFGEILIIFLALVLAWPLPLLPLQILWLNLVTDSFPALALGVEPTEKDIMKKKPRKKEKIIEGMFVYALVVGIAAFLLTAFAFYLNMDRDLEKARTMALTVIVLFELFFVFPVRSDRKLSEIGIFSNDKLVLAVLLSVVLHLMVIYSPLSVVFDLVKLNIIDWIYVLAFSIPGLAVFEGIKYLNFQKLKKEK